jgi:sulfite oxidase
LTPEDLVYCRNHGPVREFDEESYTIVVKKDSKNDVRLQLSEVKANLPLTHVVAVLQVCMRA